MDGQIVGLVIPISPPKHLSFYLQAL